jgi:hypothetical protein
MDYSEVVIAALEQYLSVKSSTTKKKGRDGESLEIIIAGTTITGANNCCNILCFICDALRQLLIIWYNLLMYSNYTKFVRKIMVYTYATAPGNGVSIAFYWRVPG